MDPNILEQIARKVLGVTLQVYNRDKPAHFVVGVQQLQQALQDAFDSGWSIGYDAGAKIKRNT